MKRMNYISITSNHALYPHILTIADYEPTIGSNITNGLRLIYNFYAMPAINKNIRYNSVIEIG